MVLPWLATPAFDFRVDPGHGLTIVAGGVPIVRGSYFQVVAPGWTKSFYNSNYQSSSIVKVDEDTVRLEFKNPDGTVTGAHTFHREGDRLKVHYEFHWTGNGDAFVELNAGFIWVPALDRAKVAALPSSADLNARRIGRDSTEIGLNGPLGSLQAKASVPLTLFDARRYAQSWAEGKDILWYGDLNLPLKRGETTAMDVEWQIPSGASAAELPPLKRTLTATHIPNARVPDESRPILIPKPQTDRLNWDKPIEITGAWRLPIGEFDHYQELKTAIARRFALPAPTAKTKAVSIDGGVSKLGLKPGGYRIDISAEKGISVLGEEDAGLQNAVERLAALAFAKGGHLYLPTGYLYDDPKVAWRGVHLFVGPEALAFHRTLWTRVLRPLGFDHVVLQCERTAWATTPGIQTPITMSKPALASLVSMYRGLDVEPIPLIQSFGHMEWLFANGKNLDLAMNPDQPYAVDPRKPRTKELLTQIWDEAVQIFKPKAIHFGLDEVDMTGWPGDDALLTDLWTRQLAFLGDLAKKKQVRPMLWGDQALASGEAPDAANGDTKADAESRRAAIPKGAWIADWHYLSDPKPETYLKVLQLWKDAGMWPIASAWYNPANIRGFDLAAGMLNAGTLQTTWAGYESNEQALTEHPEQFGAMVLAADYAWSGRKELPNELPYDPIDVFQKLYFGRPSPLYPMPGSALGDNGSPFVVGGIRFAKPLSLEIASLIQPSASAGGTIDLDLNVKGRELDLAVATLAKEDEGSKVAEITVERTGAAPLTMTLLYGRDVRALDDPAGLIRVERTPGGPSVVRFALGGLTAKRILVKPLSRITGFRLMGVTTVD